MSLNWVLKLDTIQVARYILGLSWIYHGLFPKLLHVAPLEKALTGSFGFSDQISYWITKGAGIGEVIFGIVLLICYRNRLILLANILALLFLCAFVAVNMPTLLVEAFNPVTTNFALIGLSYLLLKNATVENLHRSNGEV